MHQALIRVGANKGTGLCRGAVHQREILEAQVDPLLGDETSTQVGIGRERIVQQSEQQGDVQAQPPREHLPPSIARPATGCATVGQVSWCTSVSCGCSQLPNLVSGAYKEAVEGWKYGEGGEEQSGQGESDYKLDPSGEEITEEEELGSQEEEQSGSDEGGRRGRGRGMPSGREVSCSLMIMKTWKTAKMRVQGVSQRAEQQTG